MDMMVTPTETDAKRWARQGRRLVRSLGPGLITGASDDDPSGIATYAQVGAQQGYLLNWTIVLAYPLMAAIQEISARLGRVTGIGVAGNLRRFAPPWVLHGLVALVVAANVINIGADIGGMGAAVKLVLGGGPEWLFVVCVAVGSATLQVFAPYHRYVSLLKWLSVSLFAYVATVAVVHVSWADVLAGSFIPRIPAGAATMTSVVAVLGTTISPYLFFWQAQLEAQGQEALGDGRPLADVTRRAPADLYRIRVDTLVGMAFSNLAALFIMVTTAATLHSHGVTDIQTSAQAAEALRPIAGGFAGTVFAVGIIGTGLMGVPVLAGSAAYAVGEVFDWPVGLTHHWRGAKAFYLVVALCTLAGAAIVFMPIDPFKALFWSAVINGLLAGPVMVAILLMATSRKVMQDFTLHWGLKILGWLGAAAMGVAAAVMILGMILGTE